MESLIGDSAKGRITFRARKVITQTLLKMSARNRCPEVHAANWTRRKKANNLTSELTLELTNKLKPQQLRFTKSRDT